MFTFYSAEVRIMVMSLHTLSGLFSSVWAALNKMSGYFQVADRSSIPRNNANSFSYFLFHWNSNGRKEMNGATQLEGAS